MKKIINFNLLIVLCLGAFAQSSTQENTGLYFNVFINNDKEIRIGDDQVEFKALSQEMKERIEQDSFNPNRKVTYRIIADKNLRLGYIMDIEQQLFEAYNHNARRERYLLETSEMKFDEPGWFKKLKGIKLDTSRG